MHGIKKVETGGINEQETATMKMTKLGRLIKLSTSHEDYETYMVLCLCSEALNSYKEAVESTAWKEAIDNELNALKNLQTCEEAELLEGTKPF